MKINPSGTGVDFSVFLDYDKSAEISLYEIGRYQCPPGYSFGPVIRPRSILHYVISGKGTLKIMDREYPIHQEQVFFIPAGIMAYYRADEDDPWNYIWAHIGGATVSDAMSESGIDEFHPVKDIVPLDGQDVFGQIVKDIFSNYQREYYCIGKLYEMMDYFLNVYSKKTDTEESLQLHYVRTVIKFIQLKYSEQIRVEDIAALCNLHRSYLSRLFKDATGSTIKDYLQNYRMNEAMNLLKRTQNSVEYIAYAVGYTDIFTFSKAFKKHTGQSPSSFRNGQ